MKILSLIYSQVIPNLYTYHCTVEHKDILKNVLMYISGSPLTTIVETNLLWYYKVFNYKDSSKYLMKFMQG